MYMILRILQKSYIFLYKQLKQRVRNVHLYMFVCSWYCKIFSLINLLKRNTAIS